VRMSRLWLLMHRRCEESIDDSLDLLEEEEVLFGFLLGRTPLSCRSIVSRVSIFQPVRRCVYTVMGIALYF
jgi:hypothetical protein